MWMWKALPVLFLVAISILTGYNTIEVSIYMSTRKSNKLFKKKLKLEQKEENKRRWKVETNHYADDSQYKPLRSDFNYDSSICTSPGCNNEIFRDGLCWECYKISKQD